mgnify:FL=1
MEGQMEERPYWIAVGDLHGQAAEMERIPGIAGAQGVLISGDLTNRGTRTKAAAILEAVGRWNNRIYAQVGNMDTRDVDELLTERGINVHARLVDLGSGVHLLGIGYSTPTPFGTPSEVGDDQLAAWMNGAVQENIDRENVDWRRLIFMPHNPPFNTLTDRVQTGEAVGSRAVRGFIEDYQPAVCITGHIHESAAVDYIEKTHVINPGCLGHGGYVWVGLGEEGLVAKLCRWD